MNEFRSVASLQQNQIRLDFLQNVVDFDSILFWSIQEKTSSISIDNECLFEMRMSRLLIASVSDSRSQARTIEKCLKTYFEYLVCSKPTGLLSHNQRRVIPALRWVWNILIDELIKKLKISEVELDKCTKTTVDGTNDANTDCIIVKIRVVVEASFLMSQ